MDLAKIYDMIREGDKAKVGATYLIDHYNRGRAAIMKPKGDAALAAWKAGRDAAKAGDPNPYTT